MSKVLQEAQEVVQNIADSMLKEIGKFLASNKEFLAGMGVGAALMTPAGKALTARLGKDAVKLSQLAATYGKKTVADAVKYVMDSKVGQIMKTSAFEKAADSKSPVGKVTGLVAKVSAVDAAGKILGDYIGYTITEPNNLKKALSIIGAPVAATIDAVRGNIDAVKDQQAKQKRKREAKVTMQQAVKQIMQQAYHEGTDEYASTHGFVSRPSGSATAEYYWQKEVEKDMKKNAKFGGNNAPEWYWRGLAAKLMSTVLTWTSLKGYSTDYRFVSCCGIRVGLTIPVENNKLHTQVRANTNILWQALRGKNTGAFNYEEADVYAYQFGLSALIARHRYLCKLISLSNKYDPEVVAQTDALYDALFHNRGAIIRQEVVVNKPSYCERLNTIAKALNSYALVGTSLISRWNYLADKCISDYNGPKAVKGIYKIEMYPKLNSNYDGTDPSATDPRELIYENIDYGSATINSLITALEGDIDVIRTWYSGRLLKVAGDMIKLLGANAKAFGNTVYINGSEVPQFAYDPEAADQLRNGKMFEPDFTASNKYRTPAYRGDSANLAASVGFASASHSSDFKSNYQSAQDTWLMTSDRNKVFNNAENLQLMQFDCNISVTSSGVVQGSNINCYDHGTSILLGFTMVGYNSSNTPQGTEIKSLVCLDNQDIEYNGQGVNVSPDKYNMMLQIDFFPSPEIVRGDTAGTGLDWYGRWLDVDDYAYMSAQQYRQLNNVAVYSQTFVFNPEDVKIMGIVE